MRVIVEDILNRLGCFGMGAGGFPISADGELAEEYEEKQEETIGGNESQDGEDAGGTDSVRRAAERGPS